MANRTKVDVFYFGFVVFGFKWGGVFVLNVTWVSYRMCEWVQRER